MFSPKSALRFLRPKGALTGFFKEGAETALAELKFFPLAIPMAAFAGFSAPTGHAVSSAAGGLTPYMGSIAGGLLAGWLGAIMGQLLFDDPLREIVTENVQKLIQFRGELARLEMGQGYQDTEQAYTMRQRAAREMSGSLLNARQYLGKEAALLHA